METCLKDLLEIQELTYIISCVILMHMKNSIHHILMMAETVGVVHYHQIQQQKDGAAPEGPPCHGIPGHRLLDQEALGRLGEETACHARGGHIALLHAIYHRRPPG